MPEARVVVAGLRRGLKFFGNLSREFFAERQSDRRRRFSAGGGRVGYFTENSDFGLCGEFACETGAA